MYTEPMTITRYTATAIAAAALAATIGTGVAASASTGNVQPAGTVLYSQTVNVTCKAESSAHSVFYHSSHGHLVRLPAPKVTRSKATNHGLQCKRTVTNTYKTP